MVNANAAKESDTHTAQHSTISVVYSICIGILIGCIDSIHFSYVPYFALDTHDFSLQYDDGSKTYELI